MDTFASLINASEVHTAFRKPVWPLRCFSATLCSPDQDSNDHVKIATSKSQRQRSVLIACSDVPQLQQQGSVTAYIERATTRMLQPSGLFDGHQLRPLEGQVLFGQHLEAAYMDSLPAARTGAERKVLTERVKAKLMQQTPYKVLLACAPAPGSSGLKCVTAWLEDVMQRQRAGSCICLHLT